MWGGECREQRPNRDWHLQDLRGGWGCVGPRAGEVHLDTYVEQDVHTQVWGEHPWSQGHMFGGPLEIVELTEGRKPQVWVELTNLPTLRSSWVMPHRGKECVCVHAYVYEWAAERVGEYVKVYWCK